MTPRQCRLFAKARLPNLVPDMGSGNLVKKNNNNNGFLTADLHEFRRNSTMKSSPAGKRNPWTERQAGLRLNPFHVATYYLRSLSDAAKAEPGTAKEQKYKFLSNYFKDLPTDLESLLFEIRNRVQLIEQQVDDVRTEKHVLFNMCDEIRQVAKLPRAMYHVMSSSDKHLPTQYDSGVAKLISAVRGYLQKRLASRIESPSYLSPPSIGGTPWRQTPIVGRQPRSPSLEDPLPAQSCSLSPIAVPESPPPSPPPASGSSATPAWQQAVQAAAAQWHHREAGQGIISTRQWVQESLLATPSREAAEQSSSEGISNQHVRSPLEANLDNDIKRLSESRSPLMQSQYLSPSPDGQQSPESKRSRAVVEHPTVKLTSERKWWEDPNTSQEPLKSPPPRAVPQYPPAFQQRLNQLKAEEERVAHVQEAIYGTQTVQASSPGVSEARSAVSSIRAILKPQSPSLSAAVSKWHTPGGTRVTPREWHSESHSHSAVDGSDGPVPLQLGAQQSRDSSVDKSTSQSLAVGDDRDSGTSANMSSLILALDSMSRLVEHRETAATSWKQVESVLSSGDLPRKAQYVLRGMVVMLRDSCEHQQMDGAANAIVLFLDQLQEVPDLTDLWSRSGRLALDTAQDRLLAAVDQADESHDQLSAAGAFADHGTSSHHYESSPDISANQQPSEAADYDDVREGLSDCISSASESLSPAAATPEAARREVRSGSVSNSESSVHTSPSWNNQPEVLTLTEEECLMAASTAEAQEVAELVLANDQDRLVAKLGQLEANASNSVIDSVRAYLLAMLHAVNLDVRSLAAIGLRLLAEVQGERLLGWGEDHAGLADVADLDIGHFGGSLKHVCGGDGFTHMLTDGGQVLGFGCGNCGQLGSGSRSDCWRPAVVRGPWVDEGGGIVAIDSGECHTLACDEVGRVYIWGELGPVGWGRPFEVFGMEPIGVVACGASFCAAVTAGGGMYMWGDNSYGQLGTGDTEPRESPCMMINKAGFVVSTVACGGRHVLMGDSEGKVFSWGCGAQGQLGHGDIVSLSWPHMIEVLDRDDVDVVQLAAGDGYSCAISLDGYVMSWGENLCGQLGLGDLDTRLEPTELEVLVDKGVFARHISCGAHHTALVTTSGELFVWGDAINGQLSCAELHGKSCIKSPQRVTLPSHVPIAAARLSACGDSHTCILTGF